MSVQRNIVNRNHSIYCVTNVPKKDFIARRIDIACSDIEEKIGLFPEWPLIMKQLRKIRIDFLIKNLQSKVKKKDEPIDKSLL